VTKSAAGRSVTIESTLDRSIPKALADAGQVHQALVNLVLNGMQVMPSGGVLTVETGRAGTNVEIRVRDRGPGISKGDEEKIFEPFYTTRPGGTGLGLAMSRRIAVAHRGSLSAENAPGGGAIFRLRLPAASRAE
jgi:signal transduction histidine kinase